MAHSLINQVHVCQQCCLSYSLSFYLFSTPWTGHQSVSCHKTHQLSLVNSLNKKVNMLSLLFVKPALFLSPALLPTQTPGFHLLTLCVTSTITVTGDLDISSGFDSVKCKSGSRKPGNSSALLCVVFLTQRERERERGGCVMCGCPCGRIRVWVSSSALGPDGCVTSDGSHRRGMGWCVGGMCHPHHSQVVSAVEALDFRGPWCCCSTSTGYICLPVSKAVYCET